LNLIQKVRDTIAYRLAMHAKRKAATCCDICKTPAMRFRIRLEVHHRVPVHADPTKAADPDNMVVACASCHYHVCHLDNWSTWNSNIDVTSAQMRRAWVDNQLKERT